MFMVNIRFLGEQLENRNFASSIAKPTVTYKLILGEMGWGFATFHLKFSVTKGPYGFANDHPTSICHATNVLSHVTFFIFDKMPAARRTIILQ